MKYVSPCNERNAIKVAAFAFEFVEAIDENIIQSLIELHQENNVLKKDFPRKQLHQALTVQLDKTQPVAPKTSIDGVTLDHILPDGMQKWAITLNRNSISVHCGEYTRWEDVWSQVQTYFGLVLPLLSENEFTLVALEYLDEFSINDVNSSWKEELFSNESIFMPSNMFKLNGLWHSHHGFITMENDLSTLNNIEINYVSDAGGSHKVLIRTQHKTLMESPVSFDNVNDISSAIFNTNHEFNKKIISDLLSADMKNRIKLEV